MAPTTLTIAGPQNDDIVGILEQNEANPAPGTKIIVILHGHAYLCDTRALLKLRGHKNYCYQRYLAGIAPFDNFRFDFRGNGDSGRSIHAARTLKVIVLGNALLSLG